MDRLFRYKVNSKIVKNHWYKIFPFFSQNVSFRKLSDQIWLAEVPTDNAIKKRSVNFIEFDTDTTLTPQEPPACENFQQIDL